MSEDTIALVIIIVLVVFGLGVLWFEVKSFRKYNKVLAERPRYIFTPSEDITNQELALMIALMTRSNTFINLEGRADWSEINRHFTKI